MEMNKEGISQQFNDKYDILKHVSDIKLRLNNDITSDFVLAKLSDKDKEGIINMTGNAYYSKKILLMYANRSYHWEWKNGKWIWTKLSKDKVKEIKEIANAVFDTYMTKIYMSVILNRNVDKNYLINILSGYKDDEDDGMPVEDNKSLVKELLEDRKQNEK